MSQAELQERPSIKIYSLSQEEREQLADIKWARHDPQVQTAYAGEFVVPYQRRVVAHGTNAVAVLAEAARVTSRPAEELAVCAVHDALQDLSE